MALDNIIARENAAKENEKITLKSAALEMAVPAVLGLVVGGFSREVNSPQAALLISALGYMGVSKESEFSAKTVLRYAGYAVGLAIPYTDVLYSVIRGY